MIAPLRFSARCAALQLAAALAGCDTADPAQQSASQAQNISAALKPELGTTPQVMVNTQPGRMSQVIVIFDPESVRGKTVAEVQNIVHQAVQQQLGQEPAQISITLGNAASQPQGN